MNFYLNDGVVVEFSPELSKNIVVVRETKFMDKAHEYIVKPVEFKISDVYFLVSELIRIHIGKKIFIHRFEPIINDFYAMYYAIEV